MPKLQKIDSPAIRLIHWAGTPIGVCPRKDSKVDQEVYKIRTGATVTQLAEASHYGNITCWRCRKAHNSAFSRKRRY